MKIKENILILVKTNRYYFITEIYRLFDTHFSSED